MNPAYLGLPGNLPEQPPLGESSCSLIPCPEGGPTAEFWARVKARRLAARAAFERALETRGNGNLQLTPEVAEHWWPGTGGSSRNRP